MSNPEPDMTHQSAWLQDIDERCRRMAEITRQREEAKVIHLPIWSEGKCGSPNSFLRSALFAAIQGKDRIFLDKAILFSQQGLSVRFTGKQLNQEDMTVWLALVDLTREYPLGTECCFTAYGILKHMGLKDGGEQRKVLYDSLHRLMACGVEIKANHTTYGGSLVGNFVVDESTGRYKVTLNKTLINIFGENDWTNLNWEQRKKLRSKPLAQKLHEYYSSHMFPKPVTSEFLHNITGSTNRNKYAFKQKLKVALGELVKIGFLEGYQVEGDKITVKRVQKAPSEHKYLDG